MRFTRVSLAATILASSTLVAAQDADLTAQLDTATFEQILGYVASTGSIDTAKTAIDELLSALQLNAKNGGCPSTGTAAGSLGASVGAGSGASGSNGGNSAGININAGGSGSNSGSSDGSNTNGGASGSSSGSSDGSSTNGGASDAAGAGDSGSGASGDGSAPADGSANSGNGAGSGSGAGNAASNGGSTDPAAAANGGNPGSPASFNNFLASLGSAPSGFITSILAGLSSGLPTGIIPSTDGASGVPVTDLGLPLTVAPSGGASVSGGSGAGGSGDGAATTDGSGSFDGSAPTNGASQSTSALVTNGVTVNLNFGGATSTATGMSTFSDPNGGPSTFTSTNLASTPGVTASVGSGSPLPAGTGLGNNGAQGAGAGAGVPTDGSGAPIGGGGAPIGSSVTTGPTGAGSDPAATTSCTDLLCATISVGTNNNNGGLGNNGAQGAGVGAGALPTDGSGAPIASAVITGPAGVSVGVNDPAATTTCTDAICLSASVSSLLGADAGVLPTDGNGNIITAVVTGPAGISVGIGASPTPNPTTTCTDAICLTADVTALGTPLISAGAGVLPTDGNGNIITAVVTGPGGFTVAVNTATCSDVLCVSAAIAAASQSLIDANVNVIPTSGANLGNIASADVSALGANVAVNTATCTDAACLNVNAAVGTATLATAGVSLLDPSGGVASATISAGPVAVSAGILQSTALVALTASLGPLGLPIAI